MKKKFKNDVKKENTIFSMMKMNEKKYQTCSWSNLVVAWWLIKNCLKSYRGEKGIVYCIISPAFFT